MSDSPGVPPALGIETVEWLADGGENLTAWVTGRWRRPPPSWSGQPLLVIEAQGRRHRFAATAEPLGPNGTVPSTWRMSFSVPASLAPHVAGRGWLQLGAVVVPLAIEVPPSIPATEHASAELALRVQELEQELEEARLQSNRLEAMRTAEQRAALAARQGECAERSRGEELQHELARRSRHHEQARAVARQTRELLDELEKLRRQRDEADHAAAVARAARARAERELVEQTRARRPDRARADAVRTELALASRMPPARAVAERTRRIPAGDERLLGCERGLISAWSLRWARAAEELEAVREAPDPPPAAPAPARDASAAPPDTPAGPVDAARLQAARSRLREAVPQASPAAKAHVSAPTGRLKPWLGPVFREIVKRDAEAAGRLFVALLPAQSLVDPLPRAYDLVLSEIGCVAVTAANGQVLVETRESARPREQTQLVITGQLEGLGRLLGSRRMRRRVRRGLAHARGQRSTLKALRSLVRAPLTLEQLHAAGVRPEPPIVMRLVSLMVDPDWTRGEDFVIAHQQERAAAPGAALRVCDKATVSVGDDVELRPGSTTVICPPHSLLAVLAGVAATDAVIEGDERPLALLRSWLKRAQSG